MMLYLLSMVIVSLAMTGMAIGVLLGYVPFGEIVREPASLETVFRRADAGKKRIDCLADRRLAMHHRAVRETERRIVGEIVEKLPVALPVNGRKQPAHPGGLVQWAARKAAVCMLFLAGIDFAGQPCDFVPGL